MPEAVAVTGGNGRVGKHVLEHLASEGYRTVNLSRGKREEDHSDAYIRTDLLDAGEVLDGRLLFYDAMDMTFETVPYRRNPDCPVCGDDPIDSIEGIDYEHGCGIAAD